MYNLNSDQIDFILDDISARGIEMESLQQNLLDHVCCIIEENLEENGDFEGFYYATIKTFYKKDLSEIEEETQSLITNKHYYTMKKLMIVSGTFSAIVLSAGIILKFLHMPGAGISVVLGITTLSLVFLPLMFTLKVKEKQKTKDKVLLGLTAVIAILFSMAVMFKLMHWPFANIMGMTSIALLALVYLPIHFISGIRQADTKVNTIVSSILVIAACGLFLGLVRSPGASKAINIKDTGGFVRSEQILENEYKQVQKYLQVHQSTPALAELSNEIYTTCDELKSLIVMGETGVKKLDANFEANNTWIQDSWAAHYFKEGTQGQATRNQLELLTEKYNAQFAPTSNELVQTIPVKSTIVGMPKDRVLNVLNDLTQIQMLVLQNQMALAN